MRVDQRLRISIQAPLDAVLDLLGRMRLAEAPSEEELQEIAVVAAPVMAVVLGPTFRCLELVVEAEYLTLGMADREADGGRDVHDAADPLRMVGGHDRAPERPTRAGHEDGTFRAGGV